MQQQMTSRQQWLVLTTIAVALFMEMLDATVLNTALPVIARSLHDNPVDLKVALTSYLLSIGIFIPMSGWLADRIGPHRCFQWAILIFAAGSIGCGLSHSLAQLVTFRIVQGIGGAFLVPTGRIIMLRIFGREGAVQAMARISTITIFGMALGPIIGGAFATFLSWRLIFFINIPVGIAGFYLSRKHFPLMKPGPKRPFDIIGFILFGSSLAALLFILDILVQPDFTWTEKIVGLVISLILALIYYAYSRRAKYPIISARLFNIRQFRLLMIGSFIMRMSLSALSFLMPLLMQASYNWSAFESGLLLFASIAGALCSKRVISRAFAHLPHRMFLMVNSLACAISMGSLALLGWNFSLVPAVILLIISGFFRSNQFTLMNGLIYRSMPESLVSEGTTINSMAMQVSMSFGIALAALTIATMLHSSSLPLTHSLPAHIFSWVFALEGFIALVAMVSFAFVSFDRNQQAVTGALD